MPSQPVIAEIPQFQIQQDVSYTTAVGTPGIYISTTQTDMTTRYYSNGTGLFQIVSDGLFAVTPTTLTFIPTGETLIISTKLMP